jgi:hypothetical protein
VGLRCRVHVEGDVPDGSVDIRTKLNDPSSSVVVSSAPLKHDGSASLVVNGDKDNLIGTAASVVLLNGSGRVISNYPTIIGG